MINKAWIGDGALLFVTLCWGVTFPLIENAVREVHPAVFVTVRFILAALILLPFIWSSLRFQHVREVFVAAVILSFLTTVSYLTQTIGLQTATSAQAALIGGVAVVLVPFFLPFFKLGRPTRFDIGGSALCLIGLIVFTHVGYSHFNVGEVWVFFSALFYAFVIVYLQKVSPKLKNLSLLAFMQIILTALFASFFTLHQSYQAVFHKAALIGILFCATFATSLAIFLQTKYQHYTTATRATMIFCMESVFASLFGYLINGEKLGGYALLGAGLIVSSLILPELWRKYQRNCPNITSSPT